MVNNSIKVVGQIRLGSSVLDVYDDLDEPLFKAADIANIIEYSYGNTWRMLDMCEADEKLNLPMVVAGQRRSVSFVNEHGLYSILSQSRKEIARAWRRLFMMNLLISDEQKALIFLSSLITGIMLWIIYISTRQPDSLCNQSLL